MWFLVVASRYAASSFLTCDLHCRKRKSWKIRMGPTSVMTKWITKIDELLATLTTSNKSLVTGLFKSLTDMMTRMTNAGGQGASCCWREFGIFSPHTHTTHTKTYPPPLLVYSISHSLALLSLTLHTVRTRTHTFIFTHTFICRYHALFVMG